MASAPFTTTVPEQVSFEHHNYITNLVMILKCDSVDMDECVKWLFYIYYVQLKTKENIVVL